MSWSDLFKRFVPRGLESESRPEPFSRRFSVNITSELLRMPKLKLPNSVTRRLLAYLHSGEVVRDFLPKMFRMSAVLGLMVSVIYWLSSWPGIYREFEQWGLIKAFFAQMMTLVTFFLVARITILRAGHLGMVPADDFIILRTTTVFCRWLAEVLAVFVLGIALSYFLQPLSPLVVSLTGGQDSSGATLVGGMQMMIAVLSVMAVTPLFLFLYSIATVIDLGLAVEFNTRRERAGREAL